MPVIDQTVTVTEPIAADPHHSTCTACPHAWDAHDRIGIRYCTASTKGRLDRGCVCVHHSTTNRAARTGVMPHRGRTP
jgi:hypothetical protein